jgi:hypothetical protein
VFTGLTRLPFTQIDAPIEIVVGFYFAYQLLGVSALVGLLATCRTSAAVCACCIRGDG